MSLPSDPSRCEQVEELLEAHIDGDLDVSQRALVASHLADCGRCREVEELALAVRAELRSLPQLDAPQSLLDEVVATARRNSEARSRVASSVPWWKGLRPSPVWVLAAATLVIAIVLPLVRREQSLQTASSVTAQAEEIDRAVEEARMALSYVSAASRRAGLELRDGVILQRIMVPAVESLRPPARRPQVEEAVSENEI